MLVSLRKEAKRAVKEIVAGIEELSKVKKKEDKKKANSVLGIMKKVSYNVRA